MSTVNYSLKSKGVRLISAEKAWVQTKNGKRILNPDYLFVGKLNVTMSNMLVTASDKKKPVYKGDVSELNQTAKKQIVDHFYDDKGKRNRKTVAYFAIEKKSNQSKSSFEIKNK